MFYQNKYLKYKEKYLNLKKQFAGSSFDPSRPTGGGSALEQGGAASNDMITVLYSHRFVKPNGERIPYSVMIDGQKKLFMTRSICDNNPKNRHHIKQPLDDPSKYIEVDTCFFTLSEGTGDKVRAILDLVDAPPDIYRWEGDQVDNERARVGVYKPPGAAGGQKHRPVIKRLRKCIKCDIIREYCAWVGIRGPRFENNQCKKCRHSSYDVVRENQRRLSPDQFDRFKKEVEYMLEKITETRALKEDVIHSLIPEEPKVDDYSQIYDFEWDLLNKDRDTQLPIYLPAGNIFRGRVQVDTVKNNAAYIYTGEGILSEEKRPGELKWDRGKIMVRGQPGTLRALEDFFHIFEIKRDITDTTTGNKYNLYNHVDGPYLRLDFSARVRGKTPYDQQNILKGHKIIKKTLQNVNENRPNDPNSYENNDDFSQLSDHDFFYRTIKVSNNSRLNVGTFNLSTGQMKESSLCQIKELPYDFNPEDTTINSPSGFSFPIPEMYKRVEFLVKKIDTLMRKNNLDVLLIQESSLSFHEAWTSFNNTTYGNVLCEQTKYAIQGGPGIIWRRSSINAINFTGYKEGMGKPSAVALECRIIKDDVNIPCTIASIHGDPDAMIWSAGKLFDQFVLDSNPQNKLIFGGDFNLALDKYYDESNNWKQSEHYRKDNEDDDYNEYMKRRQDISEFEKYYFFLGPKLQAKQLKKMSKHEEIQILQSSRENSIDFVLDNFGNGQVITEADKRRTTSWEQHTREILEKKIDDLQKEITRLEQLSVIGDRTMPTNEAIELGVKLSKMQKKLSSLNDRLREIGALQYCKAGSGSCLSPEEIARQMLQTERVVSEPITFEEPCKIGGGSGRCLTPEEIAIQEKIAIQEEIDKITKEITLLKESHNNLLIALGNKATPIIEIKKLAAEKMEISKKIDNLDKDLTNLKKKLKKP